MRTLVLYFAHISDYAQKSIGFATRRRWTPEVAANIIWIMRRPLSIAFAALLLVSSLHAEMASWYTATEPGYFTESGTLFNDSQKGAASDTLAMGTVVELSNPATGVSTVTTIIDTLPELPKGRTLAITLAAADELSMLDTGIADLKVSVIREGTISRPASDNTGWYMFDLGTYQDTDDAALKYTRLMENGLRPYIEVEDGSVHLYVRHVVAYRLDEAEDLIALSGIDPTEPIPEPNPYS